MTTSHNSVNDVGSSLDCKVEYSNLIRTENHQIVKLQNLLEITLNSRDSVYYLYNVINSGYRGQIWCLIGQQSQNRTKFISSPKSQRAFASEGSTVGTVVNPSVLRPLTRARKTRRKPEGDPQTRDASPWNRETCSRGHIYREHQHQ